MLSKIPSRFTKFGYHGSVQASASMIQRAWYSSAGKFALHLRIAASREKRARERLLQHSAAVIQNSFQAYLWRKFLWHLYIYNRARRIQRSYKSYTLRLVVYRLIESRKDRCSRKIQYFYRKYSPLRRLYMRFERRRKTIALQRHAISRITHAYRSHLIWKAYKRNRNHKYYEFLRNKAIILFQCAAFIQKNWRIHKSRFPYHIFCMMRRLAVEKLNFEILNALRIQRWNRRYMPLFLERKRIERILLENKKAKVIQKFSKASVLRMEIANRISTRLLKTIKARNIIVRNIRLRILRREWKSRFRLQHIRAQTRRQIYTAASKIQNGTAKRHRSYYLPIRVAARLALFMLLYPS